MAGWTDGMMSAAGWKKGRRATKTAKQRKRVTGQRERERELCHATGIDDEGNQTSDKSDLLV